MSKRKGRSTRPGRKGPTPRNRDRTGDTDPVRRSPDAGRPSSRREVRSPSAPNSRYTPPVGNRGPFRPTWHKITGGLLIVVGISIFVLNDLEWFDVHVMPGGHNELWAVLGISVVASSSWWFGWFDRPPTGRW